MSETLRNVASACAFNVINGIGGLILNTAVITPKGAVTTYNVKVARTHSSRSSMDFHRALDVAIQCTLLFPSQQSIEPKQGDKITFEGNNYAISLVEDTSAGLGSLYRLTCIFHRDFRY